MTNLDGNYNMWGKNMTVKMRYYLLHLLVRVLGENKVHLSRVTGNSLMSRAFHTSVGRAERPARGGEGPSKQQPWREPSPTLSQGQGRNSSWRPPDRCRHLWRKHAAHPPSAWQGGSRRVNALTSLCSCLPSSASGPIADPCRGQRARSLLMQKRAGWRAESEARWKWKTCHWQLWK